MLQSASRGGGGLVGGVSAFRGGGSGPGGSGPGGGGVGLLRGGSGPGGCLLGGGLVRGSGLGGVYPSMH